jgi:Trk K+ transport system NAD-binding subunit
MPLEDLPLPDVASVTLIVRKNRLVPPRPGTAIETGDHVHLIAAPEDRGFVQLMFGRPEED